MAPPIKIEKVGDLFIASAQSKRLGVNWTTPNPMPGDELVRRLQEFGFHASDIGDALFFADQSYLQHDSVVQRHPELRRGLDERKDDNGTTN